MVAPTGVNEELPGEPAKAGRAGAELAEPQAAEAEASGPETSETRTAEPGTAGAVPVRAADKTEQEAAPAGVVPAEVVPPQPGPAGEERVPADTAGTEPAEETGDRDADDVRRLRLDEMDAGDPGERSVEVCPLLRCALTRGAMDVAGHPGIDDVIDVVKSRRAHEKGRLVGRSLGEVPARFDWGSHARVWPRRGWGVYAVEQGG